MQRSSQSIAALAAALAKAQAELVNPEKSLVGTIRSRAGDSIERQFRYASLSSGLDIVRKTLGQHEIATMQTTAIDQAAGIVSLTTVLAHASGEWIASDWPVCAIGETATPHRMGAALTYARRYALFTLVGIAGEDDLDAPDLVTPPKACSPDNLKTKNNIRSNRGQHRQSQRTASSRQRIDPVHPAKPTLAPDESAQLRDRLLAELSNLDNGDQAAHWAHRSLPEKNKLTTADAAHVEHDFCAKLESFSEQDANVPQRSGKPEQSSAPHKSAAKDGKKKPRVKAIDKSVLELAEPRRIRDREHVRNVAKLPCLICGRQPSDAHHLRFAQSRALARKVSDEFVVPLCRGHHREVHRRGGEATWWRNAGIDPIAKARAFWLKTHPMTARRRNINGDKPAIVSGVSAPNP
jgi:ERF superfamily